MDDLRFALPVRFIKQFEQDLRVIIKPRPNGVLLIDRELLLNPDRMKAILTDEVLQQFDVVLMAK